MVQILVEDNCLAKEAGIEIGQAKITAVQPTEDTDKEPSLELIEEVRDLLKREFDEKGEQVYSRQHYEEIMDKQAPLVCWRYLVHRGKSVKGALELIKSSLIWRKESDFDSLVAENMIKDFWLEAPIGFCGKTKTGQDVLVALCKNYKKPDSSIKFIVKNFVIFQLKDFESRHKNDMDKFVLVVDESETGLKNIDLDFSAWLISIRDFFPNRIAKVYLIGAPFIVRPFIRLVISWLPEQFKRITFCETLEKLLAEEVDKDQWPNEAGGTMSDTWRLAPPEAPWGHESTRFSEDNIEKLREAICFNTTRERLEQLFRMQRDYDERSTRKCQT